MLGHILQSIAYLQSKEGVNMNCVKCQGPTDFRQGTSKKTGKPYKGYKCQNELCGHFEFINEKPETKPQQKNGKVNTDTMVMSYAKDIVIAQLTMGNNIDPWQATIDGYNKLKGAL